MAKHAHNVDLSLREEGKYWTPSEWAMLCHQELLAKYLGEGWRDTFTVFDPCCGGGALTEGLQIEHLIQTTLVREDVEALGGPIHTENHILQRMDFLNHLALPDVIEEFIEEAGKPILFLMNPPYVAPGSVDQRVPTVKKIGTADTMARAFMPSSFGRASLQLCCQFFWRCASIAEELHKPFLICMYSPLAYIVRDSYNGFREWVASKMVYRGGFCFPSTEFKAINTKWPVSVGLFQSTGECNPPPSSYRFSFFDKKGKFIEKVATLDLEPATRAKRAEITLTENAPKQDQKCPTFTTGFDKSGEDGVTSSDTVCHFFFPNLATQYRTQVYTLSGPATNNNSVPIIRDKFLEMCGIYAVLRSLDFDWVTDKLEMLEPDRASPYYHEFIVNCMLYCTFEVQNNCVSFLHKFKEERIRLFNHFFWMSAQEVYDKAPSLNFWSGNTYDREVGASYNSENEPLVAELLKTHEEFIWPESQELLKVAEQLWLNSLSHRNWNHPGQQFHRWDAGYYQLRSFFYLDPLFKTKFRPSYRKLRNRIRKEQVKYGFFPADIESA